MVIAIHGKCNGFVEDLPILTVGGNHQFCSRRNRFADNEAFLTTNAVITIAIRLRYDYDPTTTHRARQLPFDASKKQPCQFFVVVVSYSRIAVESNAYRNFDHCLFKVPLSFLDPEGWSQNATLVTCPIAIA